MPIYTYHCDNCGVTFDQRQSFTDEALKTCPECEVEALHKVYQPVGIVFKGKGFYATDHKSASGSKRSSDSKSESSDSGSESKSESAAGESKKESKSPAPIAD
ncbi:MAG: zinc ribbon domain-containing protein [Anaerolineae bacterium]|nr:zinc ribbon domain-containing protein [Anaerolineae bacterium]